MDLPATDVAIAQAETRLLGLVQEVAGELNPSRAAPAVRLDSRLDRDLGIDSIGRAELVLRVESAFGVTLAAHTLGEAETPRDLLDAVLRGEKSAGVRHDRATRAPVVSEAVTAPEAAATLCMALDWHAQNHPERAHVTLETSDAPSSPVSYGAFVERARRAAGGLLELNVTAGDRVAIMLPTGMDFFVAFFGALYAGAVPVPIYPPARASQIEEHLRRQAGILANAEAKLLLTAPEMRGAATLLRSLVDSVAEVLSVDDLPDPAAAALPRIDDPAATALIQYTSGSTGAPKGVTLSHANILANIRALGGALAASSADVFVSWLPVYHDLGLIGAWLGSLYHGAPLVVMPPQRFLLRPERWLWAIHRHRGTLSAAPNFAFDLCVRAIDDTAIEGLDLSSLRFVANGSEPVSPVTVQRFAERFERYGFRPEAMAPAYGLAENTVALTVPPRGRGPLVERVSRRSLREAGAAQPARADEPAVELVSCGQPLPGHEIRVVDDTGRELSERREGRVQFRGPSATSGYFRDAAKTRSLFDGDWLESGDLGFVAGGELYVTGRTKDIIIRGGRHLHPSEIEEAVGDLPRVDRRGVAAFGVRDPRSGTERLVVLVETALPREDQAQLRGLVAAATIAVLDAPPEEIAFIPPRTLPKTASGKLRRSAARDLYEAGALERRRSVRWQLLGLGASAAVPALRRAWRTTRALLYAGYWWTAVGLLSAAAWPLLVFLPRPGWRWATMRAAARLAFWITGTRFTVERRGALPDKAVIVANHASYIDGLALAAALPGELAFVAKSELRRKPLARWPLQRLGTLFVERFDIERSLEDFRQVSEAAHRGRRLVVFPEGGLTRAPGLMPFKLGAFSVAASTGFPVVPVALAGTRSILRGDQWFPRHGPIAVTIGEAIAPRGTSLAEAARLRDAARAVVLQACGEPDLQLR